MPFARGTFSWYICDRCGERYPYIQQNREADTGLLVCDTCIDSPLPQRHFTTRVDPQGLARPRPDTGGRDPV